MTTGNLRPEEMDVFKKFFILKFLTGKFSPRVLSIVLGLCGQVLVMAEQGGSGWATGAVSVRSH